MSKVNDIWVCAHCHNVFNGDKEWREGGYCSSCAKKVQDTPSKFQSENWVKYLSQLRDKEWTHIQLSCKKHSFERVPKSGMHLGISLWRCIHCEGVLQST